MRGQQDLVAAADGAHRVGTVQQIGRAPGRPSVPMLWKPYEMRFDGIDDLLAHEDLGFSEWHAVDQGRIGP